ncbi:MAG TPA: DUF502 domain-containing protein [Bacillota bacterium]|jgi:uncharacterized membrane protein
MWKRIRAWLITGIIVLLPVYGTIYVLRVVFNFLNGLTEGLVQNIRLFGFPIPGLGFVLTIAVVILAGFLTNIWIGRQLLKGIELMVQRTPLVRTVYGTIKQIVDAFAKPNQSAFKRVVMIEWPRKGIYTLAFVTGESPRSVNEKSGEKMVNVFVATTPNPTSGFLMLVPETQVVQTSLSVEDGMKMVISGGVINPEKGNARG